MEEKKKPLTHNREMPRSFLRHKICNQATHHSSAATHNKQKPERENSNSQHISNTYVCVCVLVCIFSDA